MSSNRGESTGIRPGLFLVLAISATLAACGRSAQSSQETPAEPRLTGPVPRSAAADELGRFLAGLPGGKSGPFTELEREEAWTIHRQKLDAAWQRVEDQWIPAMREFQKKELSGARVEKSILFYPFSGPDSLMATVFFPRNAVYLMVGLEPAGTLPTLKLISKKDVPRYLEVMRDSVSSELGRSFFVTRQMDRQFRGQVTDGLLPPILMLLVRSHHTVLGYRLIRLDEEGRIIERDASYRAPGRIGNKGVEIDFRSDADGSEHKLYYFSVNLSNARLRENKPFLAFLEKLGETTTFFKATSYMTHRAQFSLIRERVLAISGTIFQDDSGIPYRLFDPAQWQVQLYGEYTQPYGSFRWLEQPDLRKAYESPERKPLAFRIGYGFARVPSNLQLARRKPAGAPK